MGVWGMGREEKPMERGGSLSTKGLGSLGLL